MPWVSKVKKSNDTIGKMCTDPNAEKAVSDDFLVQSPGIAGNESDDDSESDNTADLSISEGTGKCFKVPSPEVYLSALDIPRTHSVDELTQLVLPLDGVAHLLPDQTRRLTTWAQAARRVLLPSGLHNLCAADPSWRPASGLGSLSAQGTSLVVNAAADLRQRFEEMNVCSIRRGHCGRKAEELVLGLKPSQFAASEARSLSEFGVGLGALCRAVAERDAVLGRGGEKKLQRARRVLREWIESGADFEPEAAVAAVAARVFPQGLKAEAQYRLCVMAAASFQGVRADLQRQASGDRGERRLLVRLQEAGLDCSAMLTEDQLRVKQAELFGRAVYATPDVLLRKPALVNGDTIVHWIDSKGSCPVPGLAFGSMIEKLRRQLSNFVDLFGPGLVIWRGGFVSTTTDGLPGVRAAAWTPVVDPELCLSRLDLVDVNASDEAAMVETWVRWQ